MTQSKGNFSQLSRGIAGVTYNKKVHTCNPKLNIYLDDEDYVKALQEFTNTFKDQNATSETKKIHKTYTTRKGPLMVFSDEFVNKHAKDDKMDSHEDHDGQHENVLQTVEDLTRSILSFGAKSYDENDTVCMHFSKTKQTPRLVRPGFSARRYISNWTRYLDDEVVNKMLNNGTLKESSVFQNSTFLPNKKRRINDDLSADPSPYRILRQMMLAPGPLNEFSFTWAKNSNVQDIDEEQELGTIEIMNKNNEALTYGEMKQPFQANILSTLLVKSALNQVYQKKPVLEIDDTKDPLIKISALSKAPVEEFDMIDAIKDIVDKDTQKIQRIRLPRISESAMFNFNDNKTQRQEGFRGKALRKDGLQHIATNCNRNFSNSWTPLFIQPLTCSQSSASTILPNIKQGPLINISHDDDNRVSIKDGGVLMSEDKIVTIEFHEDGEIAPHKAELDVPFLLQPKRGRALFSNVDELHKEGLPIESAQTAPRSAAAGRLHYHSRGKPKSSYSKDRRDSVSESLTPEAMDIHGGDVDASLSLFTSHLDVKNEDGFESHSNDAKIDSVRHPNTTRSDIKTFSSNNHEGNFLQILTEHADRIAISVIRNDGGVDLAKDIKIAANKWMNGIYDSSQSLSGASDDLNAGNKNVDSQSMTFESADVKNVETEKELAISQKTQSGNKSVISQEGTRANQRQNLSNKDQGLLNQVADYKSQNESQRLQNATSDLKNLNLRNNSNVERVGAVQKEKNSDFLIGRVDDKYEFKDSSGKLTEDKTLSKRKSSKKSTSQTKANRVNSKSNQKRLSIKETEKKSGSKKLLQKASSAESTKMKVKEDADHAEAVEDVENIKEDLNKERNSSRPQSFKLDNTYDDQQSLSDEFNDLVLDDEFKFDAPNYEYWLAKRQENGGNGLTEEELEMMRLRRASVKDQREAKRRADAEKRRQDVIRKRQEVADAKRREAEALEQRLAMEQELENERRRREEEIRERKRLEREEKERIEREADEIEARKLRQIERERREKEEYRQRLEEMRQKQAEKDRLRQEELAQLAAEAELARLEEEARIALMREDERVQYLARKAKEEEERLLAEKVARKMAEEEQRRLAEEARRLAEEQAFMRAVHEARMRFVNGLRAEQVGLERDIHISPAFVWSYYDLLKWLGLELPDFEKAKVAL